MTTSSRLGTVAAVLATVFAFGGLLPAAHAATNATTSADYHNTAPREQRMDDALQNYRGAAAKNPQPGPMARAEESAKRGAHRAGEAIKHGAERTGQAIGTGAEKAGNAIRRGGEKLKEKSGS